jgi:hypothetical protein
MTLRETFENEMKINFNGEEFLFEINNINYIKWLENNFNKKWTDQELQIAFDDSCKFINLLDLQDFLLKKRNLMK